MSLGNYLSTNIIHKSKSSDDIVGNAKRILQSIKPIPQLILKHADQYERLKINEILAMQKEERRQLLTSSKSAGSLESYENISQERAKAKLTIDLELLLKGRPVLAHLAEMHYATNRNLITLEAFYKILKECGFYEPIIPLLSSISSTFTNKQGLVDYAGFLECLSKASASPSPEIRSPNQLISIPVLPAEKTPLPPVGSLPEDTLFNWTDKEWEKYYLDE
uniref:Uncharacterized protein n=1 Tax=Acrobeloides nanus TaxID=290746 RepID=A0A914EBW1_9BILA